MRFFWPSKLNPAPTALTRFGRVLHWIATGLFALATLGVAFGVLVGGYQLLTGSASYYGTPLGPTTLGISAGAFVFALLVYLTGRALRYIFSGE